MAMESFATAYPLLFHDGEQEHDKGHIGIHSVLTFKRFQGIMYQKIGIPANQLSAVFVCRRTQDTEKRQKLPINENTNFNIILNQHNPSRERDCHFLVSMKKSKKERKGPRKRSAEAENADDDDSGSSRGDLSPSDERPKSNTVNDESSSPEASSPVTPVHRPTSPVAVTAAHANGHRASSNGSSPSGKATSVDVNKVERTLLRREGMGQNGFLSPRRNVAAKGAAHRAESLKVEGRLPAQNPQSSSLQEDHRKLDKQRGSEDNAIQARPGDKSPAPSSQELSRLTVPHVDLFHQERFSDAVPQASPVHRNGVASSASPVSPSTPGLARNGSGLSGLSSTVCQGQNRNGGLASGTVVSRAPALQNGGNGRSPPPVPGNLMQRVSNGSGAIVGSGSNMVTLQQVQQAQFLHSFHQQHASHIMTSLEFSKLSGVLRGLVGMDLRGEASKACRLCSHYAERNIVPAPFHSCVHDRITSGFRGPSPAGPIGRPVKRHVEAAS